MGSPGALLLLLLVAGLCSRRMGRAGMTGACDDDGCCLRRRGPGSGGSLAATSNRRKGSRSSRFVGDTIAFGKIDSSLEVVDWAAD